MCLFLIVNVSNGGNSALYSLNHCKKISYNPKKISNNKVGTLLLTSLFRVFILVVAITFWMYKIKRLGIVSNFVPYIEVKEP